MLITFLKNSLLYGTSYFKYVLHNGVNGYQHPNIRVLVLPFFVVSNVAKINEYQRVDSHVLKHLFWGVWWKC